MNHLYVFDRASLLSVCDYWIKPLDPDEFRRIGGAVIDALQSGGAANETPDGLPISHTKPDVGLLSTGDPVPLDAVELAFELWRVKYPPLQALTDQHGSGLIFALVGTLYEEELQLSSVVRLVWWLTTILVADCKYFEKASRANEGLAASRRRSTDALGKARKKLSEKRSDQATFRKERARLLALDFFRNRPAATDDQLVQHLRSFGELASVWKSDSTYLKYTAGCRNAALRTLRPGRTNLYESR
jgi:hypothetical protein